MTPAKEKQILQRTQNNICESAARAINISSVNFSQENKNHLREAFGKPTTKITLPGGQEFDTTYIASSLGKHGQN